MLKQAQKQQNFSNANIVREFYAPQVIDRSALSAEEAWFDMQYVHGQKYSEFLERSSVAGIRLLSAKFIRYFRNLFEHATIQPVSETVFFEKAGAINAMVKERIDIDQDEIDHALMYLKQIPSGTMPVFTCHGDFTLSNMLFDNDRICLVDFLDSFIESPLIDLVKFRQDTKFHWSLLIDKDLPENRKSKIVQIFTYLDQEVENTFKENTFVQHWHDYLQVFNLIRILPYVHNQAEIKFVLQAINKILTIQK